MSDMLKITSSIHDYSIHFEKDLSFLTALLKEEDAIFIVDKNVAGLYATVFAGVAGQNNMVLLDATEDRKTLATAEEVYDHLLALKPTKKTKIISVGGGITQDVSGFVASTFYRGLNWVYVPTTLLAQADSCMGGKTSLNYRSYKNIIGTFYPPHLIYIAPSFTDTLGDEDFYSGMGEIAKLHVMGGMGTLNLLHEKLPQVADREISVILELIRSSLNIKWSYMENDEFDQGKRNMLNYGHCFGHAIETAVHYRIPHGQAVVLGMILANRVALANGYISEGLNNKLDALFLSVAKSDRGMLNSIDDQVIINAYEQDKKRVGNGLPLIMLNEQFEFFKITDLTTDEAANTLRYFKLTYCS